MIDLYYSPIGKIHLYSENGKIVGLCFDGSDEVTGSDAVIEKTKEWLDLYFDGKMPGDLPPVCFGGTPFQKRVLEIVAAIPYGEVMSYGEIADIIAKEKGIRKMSAQAVGQAVGRNPISILVPCHRVIGKNGSLVGYGGAMYRKVFLLDLEKKVKDRYVKNPSDQG